MMAEVKRIGNAPQVPDFWLARLESRLGRIEDTIARLERQIIVALGAAMVLMLAQIAALITGV